MTSTVPRFCREAALWDGLYRVGTVRTDTFDPVHPDTFAAYFEVSRTFQVLARSWIPIREAAFQRVQTHPGICPRAFQLPLGTPNFGRSDSSCRELPRSPLGPAPKMLPRRDGNQLLAGRPFPNARDPSHVLIDVDTRLPRREKLIADALKGPGPELQRGSSAVQRTHGAHHALDVP